MAASPSTVPGRDGVAAEKFARAHPRFPFELDVAQQHRAARPRRRAGRARPRAALRPARRQSRRCGMHEKTLSWRGPSARREKGVRRGPRVHRADAAVDLRAAWRVQSMRAVFARELRRVGRLRFVLRHARRGAGGDERQRFGERLGGDQRRADRAASRRSRVGGSASRCISRMSPVSSPSAMYITVMPRRAVARLDRGLDRRGAAPARQERGVQIQAREPRRIEHRASAGSVRRP